MKGRIFLHIGFWLIFCLLYTIIDLAFAGPSDLAYRMPIRFARVFFNQCIFLPFKIIPFYFLFYFTIPAFNQNKNSLLPFVYWFLVLILCLVGYRVLVPIMTDILYDEKPSFNVFGWERMLFTITDILPAVALASAVKLWRMTELARKNELLLTSEKLKSELKFLKAQTNPHFLFNTLNNIYGLARKNDLNTAPSILKLAQMMRYLLFESDQKEIPIEHEIKAISDYIDLETLRYGDKVHVDFTISEDVRRMNIAPLILLPFVENAFKHGVGESRHASHVKIDLRIIFDKLVFEISNTIETIDSSSEGGLGLKNIKRQLELIYPGKHTLLISPKDSHFTVKLSIDMN